MTPIMKPHIRAFQNTILLILLGVSELCYGQVTRTSLPTSTNPGTVALGISNGVQDVTLIITKTTFNTNNACVMFIYGVTGGPGSPGPGGYTGTGITLGGQAGVVGSTQVQVIESSQCALNLSTSSNLNTGYLLEPSLKITLKGALATSTKEIDVVYSHDFCDPDYCGNEQVWTNLGDWTDVPQGSPAILISPVMNSVLPGSSATFQWTASSGASQYCLNLGRTSGGMELKQVCTTQTSVVVTTSDLPSDGSTIYGSILTNFGSGPINSPSLSYKTVDNTVKGRISADQRSGLSLTVAWTEGVNVLSYKLRAGDEISRSNLYQVSGIPQGHPFVTFNIPTTTSVVYIQLITVTANGELIDSYTSVPATNPPPAVSATPTLSTSLNQGILTATLTNGGDAAMQFYLSVGPSVGSVQFYPGTSAFQNGSVSTLLLRTINVQAVPVGTTLYINLWYETPKIASEPGGAREWRFISETKKITTGPTSITPVGNTLATLLPTSGANREPQNFTWNAGSGPDQKEYWLTVGTTTGATNLYNSYNSAVLGLSHSLSAREAIYVPDNINTVFATIYTKISNVWYPNSIQYNLPVITTGSNPFVSFRDCITYAGPATTCTIPTGVYGIDNTQANGFPAFVVQRSNIIIQSAAAPILGGDQVIAKTVLLRTSSTSAECLPLISIAEGVHDVSISGIMLHGNNASFAATCGSPYPGQPTGKDLHIAGQGLAVSNISISNMAFQSAPAFSVQLTGPRLSNITFDHIWIDNPAVGGLTMLDSNDPNDHRVCDGLFYNPTTTDITVKNSIFTNSWTGALAIQLGTNFVADNNRFIRNYWNPYDSAGGNIFVNVCAKNTTIKNTYMDGFPVLTQASGIEVHAKGVLISDNLIIGFAYEGIGLHSAANVTIERNRITSNGLAYDSHPERPNPLKNSPGSPGVSIANRATGYARRTTSGIVLNNNIIGDVYGIPSIDLLSQRMGVAIGACPDNDPNCSNVMGISGVAEIAAVPGVSPVIPAILPIPAVTFLSGVFGETLQYTSIADKLDGNNLVPIGYVGDGRFCQHPLVTQKINAGTPTPIPNTPSQFRNGPNNTNFPSKECN